MVKVGGYVQVSWDPAADNGSPVTRYEILFASSTVVSPTFVEEVSSCDGREQAVLLALECTVPMSRFWLSTVASPLHYVQGDPIALKIRAWNAIGEGPFSDVVTGPVVETPPDTPVLPPERDEEGTTSSAISVILPEIVSGSLAAGGTTISSYNLQWN